MKRTPWVLDTSEETSGSLLIFSGGKGKLYLRHEITGETLTIRYHFFGAGASKGAAINYSEALKTDPSGGLTNVRANPGKTFARSAFPCRGWLWVGGATAGVFQPSFLSHSGVSTCMALFGWHPFAALPFWGRFNSILPGVGPSIMACSFAA